MYPDSQHQIIELIHLLLTSPCNGSRHSCTPVYSQEPICIWWLFSRLAVAQWSKSCFPWGSDVHLWFLPSKKKLQGSKQYSFFVTHWNVTSSSIVRTLAGEKGFERSWSIIIALMASSSDVGKPRSLIFFCVICVICVREFHDFLVGVFIVLSCFRVPLLDEHP